MPERLSLFATASRGTEELLAEELGALGAVRIRQERGGVRFLANLDELLRIVLWTRIAMRILYPLREAEAPGADGLYEAASQVPWEEYLTPKTTFAVDATLRDSEHAHSGFVALKIKDAIVDRLRQRSGTRPDVDTRDPDVRVVAHLAKTHLSLWLDVCGEPLHRRGYRRRQTVAPLKETIAAAMLRAAAYDGSVPLMDPMCGSGTILIEAALIARNQPPDLERHFSIRRWPGLGEKAGTRISELVHEARAGLRRAPEPILGMDYDEEALGIADINIGAASMTEFIQLAEGDATKPIDWSGPPGVLVTNPPYGDRLGAGGQKGMKSFYFKLGDNLRRLEGWKCVILAGNEAFESAYGQRPLRRRTVWNGPIECTLLEYQNPARSE